MTASAPRFDIRALAVDIPKFGEDEQGIIDASQSILQLVSAEIEAGIPSNRIVIGGISQGGVLALFTGLTTDIQLAGVIGVSTRLPLRDQIMSVRKILLKKWKINLKVAYILDGDARSSKSPLFLGSWR